MTARRGGRPPLDVKDPAVSVHVRLPSKQYDEAYAHAQRAGVTVPELIRRRSFHPRRADEAEDDDR